MATPTPPSRQAHAAHTREQLIAAAIHTLQAHSITSFTLDAVAKQANISKGGLLHHFPTKEALIAAILRHLFAVFEARVYNLYEQEPTVPGRWLRAYVRASFDDEPLPLELIGLITLMIAENEELLALVQADAAHWRERLLNDGLPAARATVIRMAADAYWTERLTATNAHDEPLRRAVLDELLRLTEVAR